MSLGRVFSSVTPRHGMEESVAWCQRAGLRIERSGFETWSGHCVVFLSMTLYHHCASLPQGVKKGIGKVEGKFNEIPGVGEWGLAQGFACNG